MALSQPMIFLQKMRGILEMHLSVPTIRTCKKVFTKQQNIISGLLNNEKVDIQDTKVDIEKEKVDIEKEKVDIQDVKVDIESILSVKGRDFSVKTTVHIHRIFEKFGFAVMQLLELKSSGASKLLSNLVQADLIEPVFGHGKGKYKFKK